MVFGDPNDIGQRQAAQVPPQQPQAVNVTVKVPAQKPATAARPRVRAARKSFLTRVGLSIGSSKTQRARRQGLSTLLTQSGIIETAAGRRYAHRGRPKGSFKYGMPIGEYKKKMHQREALYQMYKNQQDRELIQKGYSPEQIQQIRFSQQSKSQGIPSQQVQQVPENPELNQQVQQIQEAQVSPPQLPVSQSPQTQMSPTPASANSGDSFEEYIQKSTTSPNTLMMLERIRRVQNKAKVDDARAQRILRERKMVWQATALLSTPSLFKARPGEFQGWLDQPETNSLNAPNVFKIDRIKNPNILDMGGRPSILDTSKAIDPKTGRSNTINFFGGTDNIITREQNVQERPPIKLRFFR